MIIVGLVTLVLLGLSPSYVSASVAPEEDARPPYMRLETGYREKGSVKTTLFGFDAQILPKNTASSTDLETQKAALSQYQKLFDAHSDIELSPLLSAFRVFSRRSAVNPPVILWLHGSDANEHGKLPIEQVLDKGFALITVDRFNSYDLTVGTYVSNITGYVNRGAERGSKKSFEINTSSWEAQDAFSLSTEIIMVHRMCVELFKRGTEEIVLAGHSRGGILVNACAKQGITEMLKRVGVKRYFALGAMPVQMEPVTITEPVVFVSGMHDTLCPPDLMAFYYQKYLRCQANVSFILMPNMGHCPFGKTQSTTLGCTLEFFKQIFYYKFSPRMWGEVSKNYLKKLGFLCFGMRNLFTYETMQDAQNFTSACVAICDDDFRPLIRTKEGLSLNAEKIDRSQYAAFIKGNVTRGVVMKERIETQEESDLITGEIIDHMCDGLHKS